MLSAPCLPGVEIYNYPSVWAKGFALIGATEGSAPLITLLLMLAFWMSLWALAYLAIPGASRWPAVILLSTVGVSPPVLLAFQRGNIDLAVFALVTASIIALVARHSTTAGLLAGIATSLKLYPVGLILMLAGEPRRRARSITVFLIVTVIAGILLTRELPAMMSRAPQIDGASFGAGLLPLLVLDRVATAPSPLANKAIGVVLFLMLLVAIVLITSSVPTLRSGAKRLIADCDRDAAARALVLAGSGVFLTAYLIGPSFDYRLIFLIPAIAGFLRLGSRTGVSLALLLLVQMLLSYSRYVGALEYLSDLMLLLVAPGLAALCGALCFRSMRRQPAPAR